MYESNRFFVWNCSILFIRNLINPCHFSTDFAIIHSAKIIQFSKLIFSPTYIWLFSPPLHSQYLNHQTDFEYFEYSSSIHAYIFLSYDYCYDQVSPEYITNLNHFPINALQNYDEAYVTKHAYKSYLFQFYN